MKSINQVPIGPERLAGESPRAYQAFCTYRDLGPVRSIDRAWKRYCADLGKDGASDRRPGNWADWSRKYSWVERAKSHDNLIDAEQRAANAERRQKLWERRSEFEFEMQKPHEQLTRALDGLATRMTTAPLTEVTQVKIDPVDGKKITTKVRPPSGREIREVVSARNEAFKLAITRVPGIENQEREDRVPDRIVWAPREAA